MPPEAPRVKARALDSNLQMAHGERQPTRGGRGCPHPARFLLLPLLLFVAGSGPARADTFAVHSERTEIAIDRESGAVVSLKDRQTEREWLAPGGGGRLYAITLRRPGQEPLTVDLTQATAVKVRRVLESVQIQVEAHGDLPLGVRVNLAVDPQWGLLAGRITVKNKTNFAVQAVRFPLLTFPARLGPDADDDRLLLPYCDGLEIHNPEANLTGERAGQYPGAASLQLLAFYDGGGGLLSATFDRDGHRKLLGAERAGEALAPLITHYPALDARAEWTLPYPVILEAFSGDWQAAATRYRAWAERQPWCRTPLRKRKEIPAWAFQPAFYYAVSLRGQAPPDGGDRVERLAEQIAAYRETLGAPVVAMLMSWEKHDTWVTPDYFPPYGGEAGLRALTARLRQEGNRSLVFLSGLKWTLRKQIDGEQFSGEESYRERAEAWAIVGDDGQPQRLGQPEDDVGEHAQICPATPLAGELLSEAVRRCQELGIDCVQVDQIVGGGLPPCYSTTHGHPPGGGNWSARALYALFKRLRQEGRQRNPDFLLLMEEPGEFFIPVLDAYHARDYAEGRWPREGAGVRGVPLFTFVYHDYCLGYGGDSAPLNTSPERANPYQHALNLVSGKLPAGAVWRRWQPAAEVHGDQVALLRNALALLNTPAGEVLLKGRMLPTEPLRAAPLLLRFPGAAAAEERSYPALPFACYALPDGHTVRVVANLGSERQRVEVPIAATGVPGQRLSLTIYVAEGGEVSRRTDSTFTPSSYPVLLSPLSAAIVESTPAGIELVR